MEEAGVVDRVAVGPVDLHDGPYMKEEFADAADAAEGVLDTD